MELSKRVRIKTKSKKRIGRGPGSGKGAHTVGRGMKGQRSRSGYKKLKAWIRESRVKSLPKLKGIGKRSALRGYFKNKVQNYVINVDALNSFDDAAVISLETLQEKGFIKSKSKKAVVKVLGNGTLNKKITVKGLDVSESARKKIEKAGGTVS